MLKYRLKNTPRNFLSLSSKPTHTVLESEDVSGAGRSPAVSKQPYSPHNYPPASPCFPINHGAYCLQSVMNEEFCNEVEKVGRLSKEAQFSALS